MDPKDSLRFFLFSIAFVGLLLILTHRGDRFSVHFAQDLLALESTFLNI